MLPQDLSPEDRQAWADFIGEIIAAKQPTARQLDHAVASALMIAATRLGARP